MLLILLDISVLRVLEFQSLRVVEPSNNKGAQRDNKGTTEGQQEDKEGEQRDNKGTTRGINQEANRQQIL